MKEKGSARADQRRQTRQRIMDAAVALFSKRGFAATATVDIARRAGVSHGSLFAHFGSREKLLAEVVAEFGRRTAERTHELARQGRGLRAVLEAHARCLGENEDFYARLVAEGPLLPEEARRALLGINSAVSLHLEEAASQELESGRLKRVPTHLLFNTWVALLHYYLGNRELFAPGGSIIGRFGAELVDHYMGLLAPEGGLK